MGVFLLGEILQHTFHTTKEAFLKHAKPGRIQVVTRILPGDLLTPVSAFLRLRSMGTPAFLLESAAGGESFGRYSILGAAPARVAVAKEPGCSYWLDKGEQTAEPLRNLLKNFATSQANNVGQFPFCGGLVGMIGFDWVRELENLPKGPAPDIDMPLACLGDFQDFVLFDHRTLDVLFVAQVIVGESPAEDFARAQHRLASMEAVLARPLPGDLPPVESSLKIQSNVSEHEFCKGVRTLKEHIRAGDIFQAVLSQRFETDFQGDPFQLYRSLRRVNPSPYMFYLEMENGALVGASPELLVGVDGRDAQLLPIAGTRPRGKNVDEDAALEKDLCADEKENAEHMMLVDLARNDLGRVCQYGTVRVKELAQVHRFSHVIHLVSSVKGKLRTEFTAADALAASFPAGTVSGAPKVRAMEIIIENEPTNRGPYAGAVGFLDRTGRAEFCIALRMALVTPGRITFQAGAGIVADSVPEKEYAETKHKAQAVADALKLATKER